MPSYISNTRPTVFQTLLNKLGIIELSTKVNCWYCSQDSYLLPGTKNTTNHWYCHLCENINVRDSTGEIVDPSSFETTRQPVPSIPSSRSTNMENHRKTLCEDCQHNQNVIYQQLSNYIPDETHPDFNFYYENADNYKADLHRRHPLCTECQTLINNLANEQYDSLQRRSFLEVEDRSKKAIIPKRPSKTIHLVKGFLWSSIHLATLVYLTYIAVYPPGIVHTSAIHYKRLVDLIQYTFSSIRHDAFDASSFVESIKDLVIHFIDNTLKSTKALLMGVLKNNVSQQAFIQVDTIIILNSLSLLFFNWHSVLRSSYGDMDRVTNWAIYMKMQWLLFFSRFLAFGLVAMQVDRTILVITVIVYVVILFISIAIVKRKAGLWNLDLVGKQRSLVSSSDQVDLQEPVSTEAEISQFSVMETDDNMSVVDEPRQSTSHDHIDNIVSNFTSFHIIS